MRKIALADYAQPGFIDHLMATEQDHGIVQLELADGKVTIPTRLAVFNALLFEPMVYFKIFPKKADLLWTKKLSNDLINERQTFVYRKILLEADLTQFPMPPEFVMTPKAIELLRRSGYEYNDNSLKALTQIWLNVNRLYNFTIRNHGKYQQSVDIISLCQLIEEEPQIKALADIVFDDKLGTKIAEERFNVASAELIRLLKTRGALKNNPLLNFMEPGCLKAVQIPQVLLAYGPRSDLDDTMAPHSISQSSLQGLRTPADYATEYLGAKKAMYNNKSMIEKTQYYARKMRLACEAFRRYYATDCGNRLTVPTVLHKAWLMNYVDKVIIDRGKRVILTPDMLAKYSDKTVDMISLTTCRHTDGFCEHCAGRGNYEAGNFIPKQIHVGQLASTNTNSKVSQNVLSTKHLIKTKSKVYQVPDGARKYFFHSNECLLWSPTSKHELKKCFIRIERSALGPITDLSHDEDVPDAECYSQMIDFEILDAQGIPVDQVTIATEDFVPYLSAEALHYMRLNYAKLEIDNDTITIPLSKFDWNQPFFKYVVVNDDMIAFVKRYQEFFNRHLSSHTSIASAIQAATNIIYARTPINIFWIEIIIRAFMVTDDDNAAIPRVTDIDHVKFGTMDTVCSSRALSTKLAFEALGSYFSTPSTFLRDHEEGLFDDCFGI